MSNRGPGTRAAWLAALAAALWLPAPAPAEPPYVVTNLTPVGEQLTSRAYGMNAYGQVVGWSVGGDGQRHATHWYNQQTSDLHGTTHLSLLQDFTIGIHEAYAISDADQIVGTGQVKLECGERTVDVWHAFVMRPAVLTDLATPLPGDSVTDLWTFGNPCSAYNSAATAINNANQVVGWADLDNAAAIRAFLVQPQGGVWYRDLDGDRVNDLLVDLGTLGGAESSASGINDSGVVTGYAYLANSSLPARYHAFELTPAGGLYFVDANGDGANDLMRSLGTLGGRNSWGRAINNAGVIVGEADTADLQTHAFHWHNGTMTDLGTLGGRSSSAADINELGQVVGWAEDAQGRRRGFIWINGVMSDLNNSLLYGQTTGGVVITEARAINDLGQIAGFGTFGTGTSAEPRAFLLRPATPEEIVAAEAAQLAATTAIAGATSTGGGAGGSGSGAAGGTAIIRTPSTLTSGTAVSSTTAEGDDGAAPATITMPTLCGFGTASFLPLTAAGMIGARCFRARRIARLS